MSFVSVPGPRYVRRTRLFVDSEDRVEAESRDNYRFSYQVRQEIQNVISIELVDFCVPRMVAPTFLDRFDYFRFLKSGVVEETAADSNTVTDIRFTSEDGLSTLDLVSDMARPLDLSLEIIPTAGTPLDEVRIVLYFALDVVARLTIAAHPVLNETNYTFAVTSRNGATPMLATLENASTPGSFATVQFRYETGPNHMRQTSEVFGFRPNLDTEPGTNNGAEAPFSVNPYPWRYLDVHLAEAAELRPFARIHLQDEVLPGNTKPVGFPRAPRMLKAPVRSLRRLRMDLTFPPDRSPAFLADVGMQFVFDVLSLAQVPQLPEWVHQRFVV
jgi:hypothetical protein